MRRLLVLSLVLLPVGAGCSRHDSSPAVITAPRIDVRATPTSGPLLYPDRDYPDYCYEGGAYVEIVLADTVRNAIDPFTLVSVVSSDDLPYVKFTYTFWALDSTWTAAYTGSQLQDLEVLGAITDSTILVDAQAAYAYTPATAGLTAIEAQVASVNSPPPPPPDNPPPPAPQDSTGTYPGCDRMTWGRLKTMYLDP